ncbi:MAG: shikimate dehydrogenase [Rhodocyclaceae bacterium]|nr:shikimate dehydrogenase [Rhodocyclaceae bacterium]
MPDRYAVFGNPILHSQSPRIHALFAVQTGQDMRYAALLAPVDGFAAAVAAFVRDGGKGANVTVPFKEEAFRLATRLTSRAQAAGAVNTLSFADNTISGDNTDGAGLVTELKANLGCALLGKRILLLGAGGAARGVILPLLQEQPAALVIANRTEEKAVRLAREFSGNTQLMPEARGFAQLDGQAFDLVINATSTGLSDTALPLPPQLFAPGALAYEMVYGRATPFMQQARTAGARVADGLGMLVEQAAEAFFIWRGVRPATGPVLAVLRG